MQRLIEAATPLVGEWKLGQPDMFAGSVAAAILTMSARTYTGICWHLNCGIGFCADHAAVAEMVKAQVNAANLAAEVALPGGRLLPLRDLLPEHWTEPSST